MVSLLRRRMWYDKTHNTCAIMQDYDYHTIIFDLHVVVIWSDMLGDIQWWKASLSQNPSRELALNATGWPPNGQTN